MRFKSIAGYITILILLIAFVCWLAALPAGEAEAEFNDSNVTDLKLVPSLNITYFNNYSLSVNVSPGIYTINNVSFVLRPQNASETNNNSDFLTNGIPYPNPNVPFTRVATNTGGETWSFNQLRPDDIYPEIGFIWGINSSPSDSRFWRDSYHLMHFNNSFAMGANTSFFIELYATPKLTNPLSVDMQVFLVGKGFNISAFQTGNLSNEAWRNRPDVELVGTINQSSPFHHIHSAYSKHFLVRLSTNSSGAVGTKGIDISDDFWVILTTGHQLQTRGWDLKYHAGCNNSGTWYKGGGTNFTLQTGCPNVHVHFARELPLQPYNGLNISVAVGYTEGGPSYNFSSAPNTFYFNQLPNLPPNPSAFSAPAPGTYQGNVTISWLPANDPNRDPITYNVYLIAENESEQTIANGITNTSIVLNTALYPNGYYDIRVEACDNESCTPFNLLANFDESLCEFFRILNGDLEGGGSGIIGDPYLICNVCDLQNMNANLSAHYALNNSINASATSMWNGGAGFVPVGNSSFDFRGSLDGREYNINGLFINRSSTDYVGLFGYLWTGSSVSNISLTDISITGLRYVGGLTGYSYQATISNSSVAGNVSSPSWNYIGGLVGWNDGGSISLSHFIGNVSGSNAVGGLAGRSDGSISGSYAVGYVSGDNRIGGLAGENFGGSVNNSYATGNVSSNNEHAGGLVGKIMGGWVNNSYATGNATCGSNYAGGLAGENNPGSVNNSYSTGNVTGGGSYSGGLVGWNLGTVSNSFWDKQTSGKTSSSGGTGKNTSEMHSFTTYYNAGWDFLCETTNGIEDIWGINSSEHNGYPFLWWQGFTNNISFTLTYNAGAGGSINGTSPQSVNCGQNGSAVQAVPDACYVFVNWSDSVTDNPRTDTNITGNISVTANFAIYQYTLSTSSTAGGNVTTPGEAGPYTYNCNQIVNIVATNDSCYYFVNWSGTGVDAGKVADTNAASTTINMSGNYSLQANFAIYQYTLNYSAGAGGTVTGDTSQTVNCNGSGTAVTAVPDPCYAFVNWSYSSTQNPRTDTNITNNITVTANFAAALSFAGGDGSSGNPYLIQDVCGLQSMNLNLSAHYALNNDIDASATSGWNSGAGFTPVGNDSTPFTGSFNGSGYTITGLFINRSTTMYVGLFGYISGGSVSNVGLVNVDITGQAHVGGFAGHNAGGSVSTSYVTGNVSGTDSWIGGLVGTNDGGSIYNSHIAGYVVGYYTVGGLVGWNYGSSTISYSYVTANVSGLGSDFGLGTTGGLVGSNSGNGVVSRSYVTGNVSGTRSVGGLVGKNGNNILDSYATGNVFGNITNVGGLVGHNFTGGFGGVVRRSYSSGNVSGTITNIGGLVGFADGGGATNSFWDKETSGLTTSDGGTGKNTSEMKTLSTFTAATWDFICENANGTEDIWGMDQGGPDNNGYPFLSWQGLTHNVSYTLNYSAGVGGTLTGNTAQTVNCNEDGTPVTAVPDACYYFVNWSDSSTQNPRTDTNVNASINVSANFAAVTAFGGGGTAGDPFLIRDVSELQAMGCNLSAHYALNNSIDASTTSGWNGGAGFLPIGNSSNHFSGGFYGRGYSISNLFINRPSTSYVGLFGYINASTVTNASLVNVSISGRYSTGGLVGESRPNSMVSNSSVSGNVSGDEYTSGLVGSNGGTINNSHATVNVSGNHWVGGLVAHNYGGTINNSYATGIVSGTNEEVGGLVGANGDGGTVSNSYSTGYVSGTSYVGGLVGLNAYSTVHSSYAIGNVSGTGNYIGGLAGSNDGGSSTVNNSYATGDVSGTDDAGGLVGISQGTVDRSYATGNVSGTGNRIGGLVGYNYNLVSNSYAAGNVSGYSYVGGLVGLDISLVSNSYATGNVSGYQYIGGFTGYNNGGTTSYSYSTGYVNGSLNLGGLDGFNNGGTVSNSFYDTNTSGQIDTGRGEPKTTAEMKNFATFFSAGWDLICEITNGTADIWGLDQSGTGNNGYPFLWWQGFTNNVSFTLTYTAGAGGTINGTSPQVVNCSVNGSAVEAVPDSCHYFVNWSDSSTQNPRTDTSVTGNITVNANFGIYQYTLNTSSTAGGNVSVPGEGTPIGTYNCSEVVTITAAPDPCDNFIGWTGNTTTMANINSANTTITMNGSYSIQANFAVAPRALTYTAGAHGTINGTSPQMVNCSEDGSAVEAVPDACYHFVNWNDSVTDNPRTDTNVQGNVSVTANFAINTSTITSASGANGTISPLGVTVVNCGDYQVYNITPNSCYHIADVAVDSVSQGPITTYNFSNVQENHTINATFAINTYTFTVTQSANGTIAPGTTTVNCGVNQSFNITPADCYHIATVTVDNISIPGVVPAHISFPNVQVNHTVTATFAINTYTLTYIAGANGSINGTSPQTVNCGGNGSAVRAVPDAGWAFRNWSDSLTVNPRTDTNVQGNITVTANFRRAGGGGGGGSSGYQVITINVFADTSTGIVDSNGVLQQDVDATSPDGKVSIHIPTGTKALDEDGNPLTEINVEDIDTYPAPPDGKTVIAAFDFHPDGATFNPAIEITVTYDPTTLIPGADESRLVIAFYNEASGLWEYLSGTVHPDTNTITFSLTHFTAFAVMAPNELVAAPAASPTPTPIPTPTVEPTPTPTVVPTSTPTVPPTPTPTATPTAAPTAGEEGDNGPDNWVLAIIAVAGGAILAGLIGAIVRRIRK